MLFRRLRVSQRTGCAVLDAVDTGAPPQRRLASYHKLARENEWIQARTDKRLQAEREKAWRGITKQQRRLNQERNSRR